MKVFELMGKCNERDPEEKLRWYRVIVLRLEGVTKSNVRYDCEWYRSKRSSDNMSAYLKELLV